MDFTPIVRDLIRRFFVLLIIFLYQPVFGQDQYEAGKAGGLRAGSSGFDPGQVILIWTAPGDDGYSGRAAGYDIRYQPFSGGPIDTEYEWITAQTVTGEPPPSPAGSTDSMEISGLGYSIAYYFCIRAYDQFGNYSLMSNSPAATSGEYIDCPYMPGDATADGLINIFDIAWIIKFLYMDGDDPVPFEAGDVNGSGEINIYDITHLLNFVYFGGAEPVCVYEN